MLGLILSMMKLHEGRINNLDALVICKEGKKLVGQV